MRLKSDTALNFFAWINIGASAGICLIIEPLIMRVLGTNWANAAVALPYVVMTSIPLGLGAVATTVSLITISGRHTTMPLVCGAILAVPVGISVSIDLRLAAAMLVVRELITASWSTYIVRE